MAAPWEKFQQKGSVADGPWKKFGGAAAYSDANGREIISDADPRAGLPIPGTVSEGEASGAIDPYTVKPSQHFGFSSSDNPDPLAALSTFGTEFAGHVPIAGPTLRNMGENVDAWVDNNVYRPMSGHPGTTTPQDVAATNERRADANPELTTAASIAAPVASYVMASRIPGVAKALGLEGSMASRFGWGIPSSYAINTADEIAHGKDPKDAVVNALLPTAIGAPFFAFGGKGTSGGGGPREDAVEVMRQEGVPLTAGQKTGNRTTQYAESEIGGTATEAAMDKQREAYTQAALKRAGVDATRATPDVMDAAFSKLGDHFDNLAANTSVPLDIRLQNDLLSVVDDYHNTVATPAPIVERMVNRVGELAAKNGGTLKGESYQSIRSELGSYIKRSSGETQQYLRDLQEALDDAVERQLSPDLLKAWQVTRTRYKNLLDIEDAVSRAGPDAALGLVSPANLAGSLRRGNRRAYVRGKGDLNSLARAGVATMTPLPQSGTAPRQAVRNLMMGPTSFAGALAGHDTAGLPGAIAGGAAGMLAPWLLGRGMLSKPGNAFLSGETSPAIGIVARALLAQGGA